MGMSGARRRYVSNIRSGCAIAARVVSPTTAAIEAIHEAVKVCTVPSTT